MTFYKMEQPESDSDYAHTWVNGGGGNKCGMPGVECSICGDVRGLVGGLFPHPLPDSLAQDHRLSSFWPISDTAHRALRSEVEQKLRVAYPDMAPLEAGAEFRPIAWTVPTRPDGDMFWATLNGPVISKRLAIALQKIEATGFDFVPVDEVRCGTESASLEAPIPESGEPEDLEQWATTTPDGGQEFLLLSVTAEGHRSAKMVAQPACEGCGYVEVVRNEGWGYWDDDIWPDADIFRFPTTGYIVVTQRIVDLFADLGIDNVSFLKLVPGEPISDYELEEEEERAQAELSAAADAARAGRRVSSESFSDREDISLVARLLTDQGLTVGGCRVDRPQEELTKEARPDLEVGENGQLMAFVVVQTLHPDQPLPATPGFESWFHRLVDRIMSTNHQRKDFEAVNRGMHGAIRRFDAVNREHHFANVLVLLDRRSSPNMPELYDALTNDDEAERWPRRGSRDYATKGKKLRLDLCLWMDPVRQESSTLLMVKDGDESRSLFLDGLLELGNKPNPSR